LRFYFYFIPKKFYYGDGGVIFKEKPSPLCTTIANFGKTRGPLKKGNFFTSQH
jgi:hypothetical protein